MEIRRNKVSEGNIVRKYRMTKKYAHNALGQRYTKSWKIVDTQTGQTVESGNRSNLSYGHSRVNDLNNQWSREQEQKEELDQAKSEREDKFSATLQELKGDIRGATESEKAHLKALSARQRGTLIRTLRGLTDGQGGDFGSLEGIVHQIQEGGERSFGDLSRLLNSEELTALTNLAKLELSTDMSLEELGFNELRLAEQASQFDIATETERAALQAQIDAESEWWEGILSSIGSTVGTRVGMYASYKLYTAGGGGTCFDYTVPVIGKSGFIPMGELKDGDVISTTMGFKPIKKVHKYNIISDIAINGLKVTKHHPFIMADGTSKLSRDIKFGDKLWGKNKVKSVEKTKGSGTVYNLDIESHTYHVGNAILVHTGLQKS